MALSLIDVEPMQPAWGRVFQSGVFASEEWNRGGLIVSMSGNENWHGPCLWTYLEDTEFETLSYLTLLAFIDSITAFLEQGHDVLIHCNEGKYRSTYMDVAVHMKAGRMSYEKAFERIKARHPIAAIRQGTEKQLRLLEATLKGA